MLTNFFWDQLDIIQEKSLRNKENRKHHVVPHIAGRKSFAVLSHDNVNIFVPIILLFDFRFNL